MTFRKDFLNLLNLLTFPKKRRRGGQAKSQSDFEVRSEFKPIFPHCCRGLAPSGVVLSLIGGLFTAWSPGPNSFLCSKFNINRPEFCYRDQVPRTLVVYEELESSWHVTE
jgi:hypothetical protein